MIDTTFPVLLLSVDQLNFQAPEKIINPINILKIHTKLKNYYTKEPNIVMVMHGEIHRHPTASK